MSPRASVSSLRSSRCLLGQLLISKGAAIWVCFALSAGFTAAGLIFATTLPSRPTVEAMRPSLMDENGLSPMPPLGQTSTTRSRAINGTEPPVSSTIGQGLQDRRCPCRRHWITPGEASAQERRARRSQLLQRLLADGALRKAHLVWLDTLHLLRVGRSLCVARGVSVAWAAVHHLVVTYGRMRSLPLCQRTAAASSRRLRKSPWCRSCALLRALAVASSDAHGADRLNGDSGRGVSTAAGMYGKLSASALDTAGAVDQRAFARRSRALRGARAHHADDA